MRRPARRKAGRTQVSAVHSISAPTGGWNARDALANMAPNDAVKLLNWFPTTTDCQLRMGQADYATGITGIVKTLAVYNKMDGTSKLFAVDDNDVWDASSSGAASAASTTVTNGKFQYLNFGDGTSNWLVMFNGVDKPLYYNGSSWTLIDGVSTPAITGVTTTTLVHANEHKGRLYLIQKDTLSFWYLPAGAVGGAATEFDLSAFANKGGYLMWMATWSLDSGDGPDDVAVFMTSEGEVIVYRGTNPNSAADWVLMGVYQLGDPIGRRSFIKFGGDLLIITQNGVYPLSKAMQQAETTHNLATTNKIETAFSDAVLNYGSNFGWEAVDYPLQSAMLFNIPVSEGSTHKQYVMNTITKSWCEFDSWNGECFAVYNDELYYGASTVVRKAWTGTSDDGSDIIAVGKTAFNYFGQISQEKRFNMFRPLLQVNGSISFLTGFDIDFSDNEITGISTYTVTSAAQWDIDNWDQSYWAAGLTVVKQWTSPTPNVGYAVSGGIKINTKDLEVHWIANDYVYEVGGIL